MAGLVLSSLSVNDGPNVVPAAGIAGVANGIVAPGVGVPQSGAGFPPSIALQVTVQFAGSTAWVQQLSMPQTFDDLYLACYLNGYIVSKAPGRICLYYF